MINASNKYIQCLNIGKTFSGLKHNIISDVNFDMFTGEIVCVIGKNGSGKTTFLDILSGRSIPTSGELNLFLDEKKICHIDNKSTFYTTKTIQKTVAMSGTTDGLEEELTPIEYIIYLSDHNIENIKQSEFGEKIKKYFNILSLDRRFLDMPIKKYSRGMKQKVHMLYNMFREKKFLVLDEPFLGLDQTSCKQLVDTLINIKQSNVGIVIATHDLDIVSVISDKIYAIVNGKMTLIFDKKDKNLITYNILVNVANVRQYNSDVQPIETNLLKHFQTLYKIKSICVEKIADTQINICISLYDEYDVNDKIIDEQKIYYDVASIVHNITPIEKILYSYKGLNSHNLSLFFKNIMEGNTI